LNRQTNITEALRYFRNAIKKRSTAFIISDFIDERFEDALKISNRKHDLMALRINDIRESSLPNIGLVKVKDAESGKIKWIDTSNREVRETYNRWWAEKEARMKEIFNKSGVDYINIETDEDYIKPLTRLFRKREARY
jgi:uncharacterized protein (DUF58 family)